MDAISFRIPDSRRKDAPPPPPPPAINLAPPVIKYRKGRSIIDIRPDVQRVGSFCALGGDQLPKIGHGWRVHLDGRPISHERLDLIPRDVATVLHALEELGKAGAHRIPGIVRASEPTPGSCGLNCSRKTHTGRWTIARALSPEPGRFTGGCRECFHGRCPSLLAVVDEANGEPPFVLVKPEAQQTSSAELRRAVREAARQRRCDESRGRVSRVIRAGLNHPSATELGDIIGNAIRDLIRDEIAVELERQAERDDEEAGEIPADESDRWRTGMIRALDQVLSSTEADRAERLLAVMEEAVGAFVARNGIGGVR